MFLCINLIDISMDEAFSILGLCSSLNAPAVTSPYLHMNGLEGTVRISSDSPLVYGSVYDCIKGPRLHLFSQGTSMGVAYFIPCLRV